MAKIKEVLTKSEIQFWIAIVTMAVSFSVVFTKLDSKVNAIEDTMLDKGATMKADSEKADARIETKLDLIIETSKQSEIRLAEIRVELTQIRKNLNGGE